MTTRHSQLLRAAIIAGLKAGKSQHHVAADVGCGQTLVSRIARAEGVGARGRARMAPERRQRIAELICAGHKNGAIAKLVGCTRRSVLRVREDLAERQAAE